MVADVISNGNTTGDGREGASERACAAVLSCSRCANRRILSQLVRGRRPGFLENIEMSQTHAPAFEAIRPKLDEAVQADNVTAIAHKVKQILEEALRSDGLDLPPSFRVSRSDTYARRLLHRDPGGRYTAVVMTWGPGQKTALHDHGGIWCVECVVDGRMEVTQFDLLSDSGGRYRFAEQARIQASRGAAGCLIPPFEYHTLANADSGRTSLTLHVYGGEMDRCHVFEPEPDGSYRRVTKALGYHE
jgi:predicted metal-dependent enzyme (double-stranded beta helix superfamily)